MSDTVSVLRGLLAYTMWADRAVLEALKGARAEDLTRETGSSFGSVLGTMAHMLGAEQLWLSRLLGISLTHLPGREEFPTLELLAASFEDFWPQLEFFLATLTAEQVDGEFAWTSLSGEDRSAPLRQVLLHLVNHTSYHRGQVASQLRQLGYEPPSTDLLDFRGAV